MTTTHEVLTGICSVCLGRFVVEGKVPVLHGYKRPGDGAIRGNCDGMRFPMYEISPEGCVWVRDGLLVQIKNLRSHIKDLKSGKVTQLTVMRNEYDRELHRYRPVAISVTKDSNEEVLRSTGFYTWADLVEREIGNTERDIRHHEGDVQTFQKRIDAWKPGLEFISEDRLNAEKLEARDAKANAARVKRDFKALKAAFFHIGAAISKHKKGWLHAKWEWEQMYIKHNSKTSETYAKVKRLAAFGTMYPLYAKKEKRATK